MSNEASAPFVDPTQVEVLYAGNIADDDLMWIVRCSVSEFQNLILSPQDWVTALGKLPNWNAPEPILARNFAMTVGESTVDDPDGWVTIQGISETNALTLFAPKGSAARSALLTPAFSESVAKSLGVSVDAAQSMTARDIRAADADPLESFWESLALDNSTVPPQPKQLPVNVVTAMSRFYAHFEILDESEPQPDRAARIATCLLACSEDPAGFSKMLGTLSQSTQYITDGSVKAGAPITFATPLTTPSEPVYASMGETIEITCMIVQGPYQPPTGEGGTGTPDGTIIKRYGVDQPPCPDPNI